MGQRVEEGMYPPRWDWLKSQGGWRAYTPAMNAQMESALSHDNPTVAIKVRRQPYVINLSERLQSEAQPGLGGTGKSFIVRRCKAKTVFVPVDPKDDLLPDQPSLPTDHDPVYGTPPKSSPSPSRRESVASAVL